MRTTESQLRDFIHETLANEYEWEAGSKESFLLHKDGMEKSDKDNVEHYLKSMNMMESFIYLIRRLVRETLLYEGVEFRELDSPLTYSRAHNVKRLALCDTSVKEPNMRPDGKPQRDAYFNEYQEWERYGTSGRRLKKPRKGQLVPGVSDACVIGFLDYHKYGDNGWYIDYMKTRGDKGGQKVASQLVDEFFKRYADTGGMVHFGKMMHPSIGHLKDKMAEKYPDITVIGAKNF